MSRLVILIAALFFAAPAHAFDTRLLGQGGSLPLSDLAPLLAKTPKLNNEVRAALAALNKTDDAIICDGMRFPGQWKELGGLRVSPYTCKFADDRWLRIRADVRVIGKRGRVYDKPSKQAMRDASDVRETNLTWAWSKAEPPED